MLPVLVERRRADRVQLAAGKQGLQHVARVHRALGRARADDGMQLVDEEDDLPRRLRDFAEHGLQAVLELSAELRARDHRPEIELDHTLLLEGLRNIAAHDALGEPFDDGRLADARIPDEDRVVLRPARQHLDHAADLLVPADHRIELAFTGHLCQVASIPLERLILRLRACVGHALSAPDLLERRVDLLPVHARLAQDPARRAVGVRGNAEQQMFGADVVVLEALRLRLRDLERPPEIRSDARFRAALDFGTPRKFLFHSRPERGDVRAHAAQDRGGDAVLWCQEREQEVVRVDLGVRGVPAERLRCDQRLLRLLCKVDQIVSPWSSSFVSRLSWSCRRAVCAFPQTAHGRAGSAGPEVRAAL